MPAEEGLSFEVPGDHTRSLRREEARGGQTGVVCILGVDALDHHVLA